MKVDLVHPSALSRSDIEAWCAVQREIAELRNPFLSPGFAMAVGSVKPTARVAIVREGRDAVAFLAFERGTFGRARPIGAGLSDAQGLVCPPGVSWEPEPLLRASGVAVLEFDHLVDGQAPLEPFVRRREASPTVDVARGFEHYLQVRGAASKSFRRALSKHRRRQETPGLVFTAHDTAPDALVALMTWKSAQYRRTGRPDRFAKPWIRSLVTRLMAADADGSRGMLATLRLDGRPVAVQAALASDTVLALWFPAYDVAFSRWSPGQFLRLEVIRAAAAAGIGLVDLGKGFSPHKELLKTGELQVAEATVELPGAQAALHRLYREPPRRIERFVLDHPRLRVAARHTLRRLGSVRTAVGRSSG